MKQYPVIVALDGVSAVKALQIARLLKGQVWGFKVHELALREGLGVIKKLKRYGKVFVDFKLYDIPSTVEHEVRALVTLGADLVSVHASGGRDMLESAVRAGGHKVAAVTVLTSMPKSEARRVPGLASLARAAGVTTLIASPREASALKKLYRTIRLVTPGIRARGSEKHDQERTTTAEGALRGGANLLVIGRPITEAENPVAGLQKFFD